MYLTHVIVEVKIQNLQGRVRAVGTQKELWFELKSFLLAEFLLDWEKSVFVLLSS